MVFQFIVAALVAVAAAAPQAPNAQEVQILRFDSDNDGLGKWNYV